jgi:hypothetical protein
VSPASRYSRARFLHHSRCSSRVSMVTGHHLCAELSHGTPSSATGSTA